MKKNLIFTIAAAAVLGFAGMADSGAVFAADAETAGLSSDEVFVFKATQDGLAEIELGKLAQKRSKDEKVKSFGGMMAADHERIGKQISAIAQKHNWKVPTSLDDEHAKLVHSLSAKPDSEFDAAYGNEMIEAHDKAVVLFKDAAAVSDKELAAFAKKTLPTIQAHQRHAAMLPSKRPVAPALDGETRDPTMDPGRVSPPGSEQP